MQRNSIGQSEAATTELLLENTVLLNEVVDGLRLLAIDPAGEGRE